MKKIFLGLIVTFYFTTIFAGTHSNIHPKDFHHYRDKPYNEYHLQKPGAIGTTANWLYEKLKDIHSIVKDYDKILEMTSVERSCKSPFNVSKSKYEFIPIGLLEMLHPIGPEHPESYNKTKLRRDHLKEEKDFVISWNHNKSEALLFRKHYSLIIESVTPIEAVYHRGLGKYVMIEGNGRFVAIYHAYRDIIQQLGKDHVYLEVKVYHHHRFARKSIEEGIQNLRENNGVLKNFNLETILED